MNREIVEEILDHFGRTGSKNRPRIRKFHAELLYAKFARDERVLKGEELRRGKDYIDRFVKYSKGFVKYINEEALEMQITPVFFNQMNRWFTQYSSVEELDTNDDNLQEQGIYLGEDHIRFDGKLSYSRFYKIISDEGESLNDQRNWLFSDKDIPSYDFIDFSEKSNPVFNSKLILLKFYVLRKIDEVAFVTSRYVHCPVCGANYAIPATMIDFVATYRCENMVGDKPCNTTLKKFPARKMIPTYIYEAAFEIHSSEGVEYKEFFLESFQELNPGYHTGMIFGRTEAKSNTFYFTCLKAHKEKSKVDFILRTYEEHGTKHGIFNLIDSIIDYIKSVGFIIDKDKARLTFTIELIKKLNVLFNREINLDHSLYYGAPGIGKTVALTLLHNVFYSNSGFISGPRFSIPGLTGGQKEVHYQDMAKKKNVPGLFSLPSFIFDEINNDQFLQDDKAVNLLKSAALSASGTSSTVGGKEFQRIALMAGTANYDTDHLKHYENKIKKMFLREAKEAPVEKRQENFFDDEIEDPENKIPEGFDYYMPLDSYSPSIPKLLKIAVIRTREEGKNYLTAFSKPLMERFYWSVLVHPKFDRSYIRHKEVDVMAHLKSREDIYSQREKITQLYIADFDSMIKEQYNVTINAFKNPDIEAKWGKQVSEFLKEMSIKYHNFFSMFKRIEQVHVFTLFTLSILNKETELSWETKRVYEKLISLLHTPIDVKDFHTPDYENFIYIHESRAELLEWITAHPGEDIREYVDYDNHSIPRINLVALENSHKITKLSTYKYKMNETPDFGGTQNEKI